MPAAKLNPVDADTSVTRPSPEPAKPRDRYREAALAAAQAAIDKKAIEPVLIDLTQSQSYTDYLLVASANSPRGVKAIAEHVVEVLAEHGLRQLGTEGVRDGRWALLDFGDVVVHVFEHPLREFYDLEGMWFDAPRLPLSVPPEQRLAAQSAHRYDEDDEPEQDTRKVVRSSYGAME
ncbi:MAG: ribosome silencing factor [Polyangia bacterium]